MWRCFHLRNWKHPNHEMNGNGRGDCWAPNYMQPPLYCATGKLCQQKQATKFLLKQKNGRVWNSSLPSDIGSLILINGSWNSPRLPLPCGKNVAWSRQCHLRASQRTRLIGLLTTLQHKIHSSRMPVWNLRPSGNIPAAPSNGTFREIHRELLEEDSTVWCHVGKLQPKGFWLICLGSRGRKRDILGQWRYKANKVSRHKTHRGCGACPTKEPSRGYSATCSSYTGDAKHKPESLYLG